MTKLQFLKQLKDFENQESRLYYVAFITKSTKTQLRDAKGIVDVCFKKDVCPYSKLSYKAKETLRKYKYIL